MPLLPTFIRHRGTTKFKPKIFVLWPKGSPCRAQVVWPVGGDLWARAPFQVYADGRGMVWEERGHVCGSHSTDEDGSHSFLNRERGERAFWRQRKGEKICSQSSDRRKDVERTCLSLQSVEWIRAKNGERAKKILKRRGSICRKRWNKRPRRSF